jgi:4-alpha-glucanotransferase
MGLHRLYVIPKGASAREGTYVSQPAEELWAIVALESVRAGSRVVGENLGTVPPEVGSALRDHRALGMHVLQLEVTPAAPEPVRPPPTNAVASLNTHDMPAFAGWRTGDDIRKLHAIGLFDDARADRETRTRDLEVQALARLPAPPPADGDPPLLRPALRWLGESPAPLVLVSLDDLIGADQPHNVPGTTHEHPNWRRRQRRSLEGVEASPAVARALETLRAARGMGGAVALPEEAADDR